MAKENPKIIIACGPCEETGVIAVQGAVGTVCAHCDGHGFIEQSYKPFTGQKRRPGIKTIRRSGQGVLPIGIKRDDAGVAYDDFLRGKRP
jgi:hypothetical protein